MKKWNLNYFWGTNKSKIDLKISSRKFLDQNSSRIMKYWKNYCFELL